MFARHGVEETATEGVSGRQRHVEDPQQGQHDQRASVDERHVTQRRFNAPAKQAVTGQALFCTGGGQAARAPVGHDGRGQVPHHEPGRSDGPEAEPAVHPQVRTEHVRPNGQRQGGACAQQQPVTQSTASSDQFAQQDPRHRMGEQEQGGDRTRIAVVAQDRQAKRERADEHHRRLHKTQRFDFEGDVPSLRQVLAQRWQALDRTHATASVALVRFM